MFDIKKFDSFKPKKRTKEIDVPELKTFFEKDTKPVFKIQNVSGTDIGRIQHEVSISKNESVRKLIEAVSSGEMKHIAQGVRSYVDEQGNLLPTDLISKTYWIMYGLVEPKFNLEQIIKFRESFPETFYTVSKEILQLSQMGDEILGE
jgi:hypothetical protein